MPMNNRLLVPQKLPLLLDYAPGAAAAYSLRSLSNSYVGPVVTVRRSTDSAERDFTATEVSDGTLAAWCGGGDGFVKVWHDQSLNNRDATQATTAAQPKVVSSGVLVTEGGKAAVRFDGVDDFLAFSAITSASPWSFFEVKRRLSGSVVGPTVGHQSAGSGPYPAYEYLDDKTYVRNRAGYGYIDNALSSQAVYVTVSVSDAIDALRFYRDGAQEILTTVSSATLKDFDAIGCANASSFSNGTISELLIYPTDMTALRTRIEADMAWYY